MCYFEFTLSVITIVLVIRKMGLGKFLGVRNPKITL